MQSEESVETKNAKEKVAAAKDKVILKIRHLLEPQPTSNSVFN